MNNIYEPPYWTRDFLFDWKIYPKLVWRPLAHANRSFNHWNFINVLGQNEKTLLETKTLIFSRRKWPSGVWKRDTMFNTWEDINVNVNS